MYTLEPSKHFCANKEGYEFRDFLVSFFKCNDYSEYIDLEYCLDLSEVVYMDTFSFRLVFDFMPKFVSIIPPRCEKVIELYDLWLESKKGLKK